VNRVNGAVRLRSRLVLLLVTLLAAAPNARAQNITRSEYIRYVPLRYPRLVRQTAASVELQLFGDTAAAEYADAAPRNGIDDRRDVVLSALAARFGPYLVRNTSALPMDWKKFRDGARVFPLHIDEWETSSSPIALTHSSEIDMGAVGNSPCTAATAPSRALPVNDDCLLVRLLHDFDPDAPSNEYYRRSAVSPSTVPFSVLYFDFPGDDPQSWKREYDAGISTQLARRYSTYPHVYVHPFVTRRGSGDAKGYELLLQFWFFYPFNDGANKHEGDWEHINVAIAPRSLVAQPLAASDVRAMLDRRPNELGGQDPLVIRRVEHFIHDHVMTLDYSTPNAYLPRSEWKAEFERMPKERVGEAKLVAAIRQRTYADRAESVINTHPIGFIGGDSKGPELILAPPGSRNRDSHGTYPFTGLYKDVGPAGATEQIRRRLDIHQHPPGGTTPWPGFVERFDESSRLELVPDWERIVDLVREDPAVRREWSWLLLPIRWGFPATVSPFAGIIGNAETGNLSPVGPSFSGGWNRSGASTGFSAYEPNEFSAAFPLAPTDVIRNDFGFFNSVLLVFTALPPFDLLYKGILHPVRAALPPPAAPVFAPVTPENFRVFGLGAGVSTQFLGDEWAFLLFNRKQFPALAAGLTSAGLDTTSFDATAVVANSTSPIYQVTSILGPRFITLNSVRYSTSILGADFKSTTGPLLVPVRGTLKFWEYSGSVRYNLLTRAVQPYAKVGFGLSWYRLTDVRVAGTPLATPDADWVRKPSISPLSNVFPNTWHYGAGVEIIPVHPRAPLTGVSVGLQLEWAVYNHSLGLGDLTIPSELALTRDISIHRQTLAAILVIAF
jgi:hypothetical protein